MGISASAPWLRFYGNTPAHLDYPEKTMFDMVKRIADIYPDEPAYEFFDIKTD